VKPVNLLPERFRPPQASGGKSGSAYVVLGGLCVLLGCVLALVLTQRQIESGRAASARLQDETRVAEARAAQLGDFGSFAALKEQRLASVRRLAAARVDWERVVRELARVLPEGVRLRELQASAGAGASGAAGAAPAAGAAAATTASGPTVTLAGCAPDHQAVATTVVRLRELHRATEVRLTGSSRGEDPSDGEAGGDDAGSDAGGGAACRRGEADWGASVTLSPEPQVAAEEDAGGVPDHLGGGS
jgi:Tfp pilus assembly protein PilN